MTHRLFGVAGITLVILFLCAPRAQAAAAPDRLIGLHSAQVLSQSMPWIAQEAGIFKKYDLDFRLVFISSSPVATAATLSGDAEIAVTGAIGNVRVFVQGSWSPADSQRRPHDPARAAGVGALAEA